MKRQKSLLGLDRAHFARAAVACLVVGTSACSESAATAPAPTITDYDGRWEFTFKSTVKIEQEGVQCIDGTGLVSVVNGRVVGTTFAELEGVTRPQGGLEGRIIAGENGALLTVARSQGGRNAFTAMIDTSLPGMAGTWQDIHGCAGTFSATRV